MFGFVFGTVCLVGLIKAIRGNCHGYGRCGFSRCGGYDFDTGPRPSYGGRRGRFGSRFFLRRMFEMLDTTPGQEKVVAQAADQLASALHEAKDKLRDSRREFAAVIRGDVVDEAALSEIFLAHDTVISETRRSVVEALGKAHEALTEEQRARVADVIERRAGARFWM